MCYAWDKLDEGRKVEVAESDYKDLINLFGRVLVNGCRHLFKKGLDRNYVEITQEYFGIKGKIEFKESLNKNLFKQGRSICSFDQFEYNILQNQLLKATLYRITKVNGLESALRKEIWGCYWRFVEVKDIEVEVSLFSKVRIHRNNSFYDLLLRICKLIIENTVLDQRTGTYHFKEFMGSEKAMANLFESFVRNFYKIEQKDYSVRREDIQWDAIPIGESNAGYLPKMQTDITLESSHRKIIIETKYYVNALTSRYDSEKYNSANLYQLYSYLRNIENKLSNPLNSSCEGILLYPTVDYSLNEKYESGSHFIRIATIDLNQSWPNIRLNLLELLSTF